jgi:hypothetical protein
MSGTNFHPFIDRLLVRPLLECLNICCKVQGEGAYKFRASRGNWSCIRDVVVYPRLMGRRVDPARVFILTHADEDKPDEATDGLPEIEPNSMITIDQDFSVDERTLEFSEGYLSLELMLSDPMTGKLRSVQKHRGLRRLNTCTRCFLRTCGSLEGLICLQIGLRACSIRSQS